MVGILFCVHVFLRTEASTSREIVGVLEDLGVNTDDIRRIKWVSFVQFERAEDGGLCGNGAVVALQ